MLRMEGWWDQGRWNEVRKGGERWDVEGSGGYMTETGVKCTEALKLNKRESRNTKQNTYPQLRVLRATLMLPRH